MNVVFNYIEHFMEIDGVIIDVQEAIGGNARSQSGRHDPSQLNWKQSHARLNHHEHDTPNCSSASDAQRFFVQGSISLDLPEYLEDPEHD